MRPDLNKVYLRDATEETRASFETRLNWLASIFNNLRKTAQEKLTELCISEMSLLEEKNFAKGFSSVSIRYVGIFHHVKRTMLAIKYMVTLCPTFYCHKTSGETLID